MSDMACEAISGNIEDFGLNLSFFRLINNNHLQSLDGYILAVRFFGRVEIIFIIIMKK